MDSKQRICESEIRNAGGINSDAVLVEAERRIQALEDEVARLEESVHLLNGRIAQLLEDDTKLFKAMFSVRAIADSIIKEQSGRT